MQRIKFALVKSVDPTSPSRQSQQAHLRQSSCQRWSSALSRNRSFIALWHPKHSGTDDDENDDDDDDDDDEQVLFVVDKPCWWGFDVPFEISLMFLETPSLGTPNEFELLLQFCLELFTCLLVDVDDDISSRFGLIIVFS